MNVPLLSGSDIYKSLSRMGFYEIHRKGSHIKMEHNDGRRIVFPYHKEVDRFTLKEVLKDADIEIEEFLKFL